MEVTGTAQHEAWQSRSLPPVEELRNGLWSIPVPIPHNPLRYVSVHAFALDGGGLGLLDTGWESDDGWTALTGGLASIGGSVDDVRGVLVTHLHFDHLGLANRVREASGAWVAMHPADATLVAGLNRRGGAATIAAEVDFLVGLGADPDDATADVGPAENMERFTRMAVPDRLLEDGDLADFPGWRLRAVHTPGHTPATSASPTRTGGCSSPGTTCCRGSAPTSPPASGRPRPAARLPRLAGRRPRPDPVEVLPAHEWRFRGLADRTDALTAPRAPPDRAARRHPCAPGSTRGASPPT